MTSQIEQYLQEYTNRSAAWWVARVQECVQKNLSKGDDPNHDDTDPLAFVKDLAAIIRPMLPPGDHYDANMRMGALTSVVLALWYSRLAYAKSHAAARPVALRAQSYDLWMRFTLSLVSALFDEREDATFFPQEWDWTFHPSATDGDFT